AICIERDPIVAQQHFASGLGVNRIGIIQEGRTEHAGDVDHDPKRYQDAEEDSLRMLLTSVVRCCRRGLRVYGPGRKRIHRQAEIIRERYASQEIGSVASDAVRQGSESEGFLQEQGFRDTDSMVQEGGVRVPGNIENSESWPARR